MFPRIELCAKNVWVGGKDLVLGSLVSLLIWPSFIVICSLNVFLRLSVQLAYHLLCGHNSYLVADGEDSVFGYRVKNNCNSLIQGYQVIKGTPSVGLIREKFSHLLKSQKDYSRLTYIFTRKWGYFCWKRHDSFDISKHIRVLDCQDVVHWDERKLLDNMGSLFGSELPPTRPQWEVLLIPNYEGEADKYVLITRFNHAYSDALSYFLMVNEYIADEKAKLPFDPTRLPFKVPLWAQLVLWGKSFLLGPYSFIAIMTTFIFDSSAFNVPVYSERKVVARSGPIPLEVVRRIKQTSNTSVTAILYTAVYDALHKAHVTHFPQEPVPDHLHLGSVMAMFPYWGSRKMGNQFTLWPYTAPLPVNGGGLKERLRISHEIVHQGMGSHGPLFNFYLSRALGSIPTPLHTLLWQLSGCPVMLSNVPGFTSPLKIFGGEMVDGSGFLPLMSTVGIGLATQTYCGELRLNCIIDSKVFPKRSDLQGFIDDILANLWELAVIYEVMNEDEIPKGILPSGRNQEIKELDENGNVLIIPDKNKTFIMRHRRCPSISQGLDLTTTNSKGIKCNNDLAVKVPLGHQDSRMSLGHVDSSNMQVIVGTCIQAQC